MHSIDIAPYENTPQDAVVTTTHYQDGQHFCEHRHRCGQFAYAASGVVSVLTEQGNWVVPSQRAIWVPADVPHTMQMSGPVLMLNTYVRARAANRLDLPGQCQVLEVSELLRQLLIRAADIPPCYAPHGIQGQLMNLLLHEIGAMAALPLNAPLPAEPRLMKACRALLERPSMEWATDEMAQRAGMSRRTFTRLFRQQTGVSFVQWRQQACLLAAVVRLGNGQPVARVATDLGYSSPSAFSGVFRKVLREAPSRYFAQARD